MKSLKLGLAFLAIITVYNAEAQDLKRAWGAGIQTQINTDIGYRNDIPVDNLKRFSGAGSFDYQRFLKKELTYIISLEYNSRQTYFSSNNNNSGRLYQSFLTLPIGFGWFEKVKRENKNAVKQHYTQVLVGGYIESVMQQGVSDSSQVYFDLKDKYFDYFRYGAYFEVAYSIMPSDKEFVGHTFGIQSRWNPNGADFRAGGDAIKNSGYLVSTFFYRILFDIKFRE